MRRPSLLDRVGRTLRALRRDERGNVIIYATLTGGVILGMIGLALDGSRAMITDSEAQAAADAAALAAATQLRGQETAIEDATAAAHSVINEQRFAEESSATITITGIRFLSSLPGNDNDLIPSSMVTTDPAQARFVEVTTQALTHSNTFLRAVSTLNTVQIRGVAVAGFRQMYCKIPPLMICNPDEVNPGDPFNASHVGAQVRAKVGGGTNAQWGPGAFGLLEAPYCQENGGGANCLRDELANVAPNSCFENQVDVQPGQATGPVQTGMNSRFGIYESPVQMSATTPPDINVTQNFATANGANRCYTPTVTGGQAFPDDTVLSADRVGNGEWNCLAYWTANHSQPPPAGCTATARAPMTRHAVYELERTTPSNFGQANCGVPGQNDRRILYMVVVNCKANPPSGSSTNLPVEALAKMFLLRPVPQSSTTTGGAIPNFTVDLEVVEVVEPGTNNEVLKDDVQLYR